MQFLLPFLISCGCEGLVIWRIHLCDDIEDKELELAMKEAADKAREEF
jgi:hypothetical protein